MRKEESACSLDFSKPDSFAHCDNHACSRVILASPWPCCVEKTFIVNVRGDARVAQIHMAATLLGLLSFKQKYLNLQR